MIHRSDHFNDGGSCVGRLNSELSKTVEIGRGSFGAVLRAKFDADGQYYAVKQTRKVISGPVDLQHRLQEVYALSVCNHPNLLRYFDSWIEDKSVFVRTEWVSGGQILKHAPQPWSQQKLCDLLKQMSMALHWLHSCNIAHLDVKPENILVAVCKDGVLVYKLGDFGLAQRIEDTPDGTGEYFQGQNDDDGDARYLCPFAMASMCNRGKLGVEADIYALGASVVELMGGIPELVRKKDYGRNFENRQMYTEEFCDLIRWMTEHEPSRRPSSFLVLQTVVDMELELYYPHQQARVKSTLAARRNTIDQLRQELDNLNRETDSPPCAQ
jgi:serine/threonine protein kinase